MAIELLLTRVRDKYWQLPPQQQKLADYVLKNPAEIAFLSVEEVSKRAGVGAATVVRFAQSIGYKGFDEVRLAFRQQAIHNQETPFDRLEHVLQGIGKLDDIVTRSFRTDIENLETMMIEFSSQAFQRVVDKICTCRRIFLVGLGSCLSLAYFLHFHFKRLSFDVELVTGGGLNLFESLAFIEQNDLLILISFPRYSVDSLNALKYASKCRTYSVLISDRLETPLAKIASDTLLAKCNTTGFFNSFVAAMALCNALVLAVSLNDPNRSASSLKKLDITKSEYHLYL